MAKCLIVLLVLVSLVSQHLAQTVNSVRLVNANTGSVIKTIQNGDIFNTHTIGTTSLNIESLASPAGSHTYLLDGTVNRLENVAPYFLYGNSGSTVLNWPTATLFGSHTLRVIAHSGSGGTGSQSPPFNRNFQILNTVAGNAPGKTEAEAFTGFFDDSSGNSGGQACGANQGGTNLVDLQITSDVGGGCNVGWVSAGEYLDYTIDFASTQSYILSGRFAANLNNQKTIRVLVDGSSRGTITFTGTGGWQNWETHQTNIGSVSAGIHTVRIEFVSGNLNFNFFNINPSSPPPPTTPPPPSSNPQISTDGRRFHPVVVTYTGPSRSETSSATFTNFRLNCAFTRGSTTWNIAGFFAADGNAAETSATSGNKWRCIFTPPFDGSYTVTASFRTGTDVALSSSATAGSPTSFNGLQSSFSISGLGNDPRNKGILEYVGEHYLRYSRTGQYHIKGGADSPENFLAYFEFDGTATNRQIYAPHSNDFNPGDPTWQGGKGQNIIGAINYLASKGMNSIYMVTMNAPLGDGKDVYPWTNQNARFTFDVSKLDQWDIVFTHMDTKDIMLHIVTQETENDQQLDGGALGRERTVYYRELIARFGYHLAITWNLGEENTNTNAQRADFVDFFADLDAYKHHIVYHTFPSQQNTVFTPLIGNPNFRGASIQKNPNLQAPEVKKWWTESENVGPKWVVSSDETGPANTGVTADPPNANHITHRTQVMWGNILQGGAGCEWYFGRQDQSLQDFRSRDSVWEWTKHALDFMADMPFVSMRPCANNLGSGYCFEHNSFSILSLPTGGTLNVSTRIGPGTWVVQFYNPRNGNFNNVQTINGNSITAPNGQDWIAIVKPQGFNIPTN